MSTVDKVKAARNPQEAMLALAEGIDALSAQLTLPRADAWNGWGENPHLPDDYTPPAASTVEHTAEGAVVAVSAKPAEERMEQRRQLERQRLKLAEAHPEVFDADTDWTEVFAKGGGLWLYTTQRDIFMEYAWDVRQWMVDDVERYDPQAAADMGRDVLKRDSIYPNDQGVGAIHVSNL